MALLDPLTTGLAAAVAGLGSLFAPTPPGPPVLPGYADADYVRVAPELPGRLVAVSVVRGSRVAAGDLLFEQDATAERAALTQAEAQAATARAQLANLLTGRRPAEVDVVVAQLHEAEAQARLAQRQMERRSQLAATKVASIQDVDIARADLEAAQARVGSLSAQIEVARLPARPDEVKAAEGISHRLARRAMRYDGTCTGEHGVGLHKMGYLDEEHGEDTVEIMRKIKRALDPNNILNPGKVVGF